MRIERGHREVERGLRRGDIGQLSLQDPRFGFGLCARLQPAPGPRRAAAHRQPGGGEAQRLHQEPAARKAALCDLFLSVKVVRHRPTSIPHPVAEMSIPESRARNPRRLPVYLTTDSRRCLPPDSPPFSASHFSPRISATTAFRSFVFPRSSAASTTSGGRTVRSSARSGSPRSRPSASQAEWLKARPNNSNACSLSPADTRTLARPTNERMAEGVRPISIAAAKLSLKYCLAWASSPRAWAMLPKLSRVTVVAMRSPISSKTARASWQNCRASACRPCSENTSERLLRSPAALPRSPKALKSMRLS